MQIGNELNVNLTQRSMGAEISLLWCLLPGFHTFDCRIFDTGFSYNYTSHHGQNTVSWTDVLLSQLFGLLYHFQLCLIDNIRRPLSFSTRILVLHFYNWLFLRGWTLVRKNIHRTFYTYTVLDSWCVLSMTRNIESNHFPITFTEWWID